MSRVETPRVLAALRKAQSSGQAVFPLSLAHYMETLKRQTLDRRDRLATFMRELSAGITVAPIQAVVRHELDVALEHCFATRVAYEPFEFLGFGLTHAAGQNFGFQVQWPHDANDIPTSQRITFEQSILEMAEHSLLSGVLSTEDADEQRPVMDLTPDRKFKAALEAWRGVASRYSLDELERRIYAITLNDILDELLEALTRHKISLEEFALLAEAGWRVFLDDMPSRKADMHLRWQWAKNASLKPKDSDLNDWTYLGVAASYCDIVAMEKQMANLFSRGFDTRATLISQLDRLPDLLE